VSREDIAGESTYQVLSKSKSFKDGVTAGVESNTVECRLDVLPGFFRVVRGRNSFYASVFGTKLNMLRIVFKKNTLPDGTPSNVYSRRVTFRSWIFGHPK
jgi:hypothetical protein